MRTVAISELAENDFNLNISRFIDTSEAEVEVDIKAVHIKLDALEQREANIDAKLAGFLKELGV
jgi:type I restriction enzyme M protein